MRVVAALVELVGAAAVLVAVGVLAGWPWALLVAGLLAIVVGYAVDPARATTPSVRAERAKVR